MSEDLLLSAQSLSLYVNSSSGSGLLSRVCEAFHNSRQIHPADSGQLSTKFDRGLEYLANMV